MENGKFKDWQPLKRRGIGAEPAKSAGITPTGRPAGGPIISRKLSRKPTPDHSPLLKVSLLQSTIRANPVAEVEISAFFWNTVSGRIPDIRQMNLLITISMKRLKTRVVRDIRPFLIFGPDNRMYE